MRLAVDVDLLSLEFQIRLDDSLNGPHIWTTIQVECLDKLGYVVRILPLLDSLEEAEVHHHDGRRATDTRRAMNVDRESLVVYHIVQMLRDHEQIGAVVIFVVI